MIVLRLLSACVIIGVCVLVALDLRRRRGSWNMAVQLLRERWKDGTRVFRRDGTLSPLDRGRHGVYVVTLALGVILMATGFVPLIILGQHLTGVLLVVHVAVAPLFAVGMSAVALLWSRRHEFHRGDWEIVVHAWRRRSLTLDETAPFLLKKWYWLALVLTLPLILTVILELFPLFGTEGEELLIRLHAYSALALTVTIILHTYLVALFGSARNKNSSIKGDLQ